MDPIKDPEHPHDEPWLNEIIDEARALGLAPSQKRKRAQERRGRKN